MEKKELNKIEIPEGKFCGKGCLDNCYYYKDQPKFRCEARGEIIHWPIDNCPYYKEK
ncbi:MAG: hypothetical protein IKD69_05290 [Solobacterium sp.]|nr:hypothetical protein [Solobacterium sp.]